MTETITTILKAQNDQFAAVMTRSSGIIKQVETQALRLGASIVGAFAGAQVIGSVKALVGRMNDLDDISQRLELPVEELQVLSQVAALGGANVETLAKAAVKMRLAGIRAAEGSEEQRKALEALGIEAKRFESLGTVDQLKAFANGFNEATDKSAAFESVMQILGRNGTELIPVLRAGADAIDDVARKLRVISADDVHEIAQMSDQMELLANNIKNDLSRALVNVAPLLEKFTGLLSEAAGGFAILTSPAGATGMQGGWLGGVDILRNLDVLEKQRSKIDGMLSGGGDKWVRGRSFGKEGLRGGFLKPLSTHASDVAKEIAALEARFKGLSGQSKAFAEEVFQFEKLSKSGLSGDALRNAMAPYAARTEAIQESLSAERKLAAIRADSGEAVESQTAAMKKQGDEARRLFDELHGLKSRVGSRVMSGMPAEMRRDMAQAQLSGILSGSGVSSLEELRRRIGGAGDDKSKVGDLKALDQALDKLAEIKNANAEIQRAAAAERAQEAERAHKALQVAEMNAEAARKVAETDKRRAFLLAEIEALKLLVDGQKAKADMMMREIELRRSAAGLAEEIGVSEKKALEILRTKLDLENQINRASGGGGAGRRLLRRHEIGFGSSRLEGREGFLGGSSMLRNHEIERRAERSRRNNDDQSKYWEKHYEQQGVIVDALEKLGVI